MQHSTFFAAALTCALLAGCSRATPTPREGTVRVKILGPDDLQTSAVEPHRISWDRPVRSASGATLPDREVLDALRRAARIVEWPSGTPVAGNWLTVPPDALMDRPSLSFVRSGRPGAGWEALVVDLGQLPAQFHSPHVL